MKSATPKVLHEICGRSLVGHVVSAARVLDPEHLVVVVGHAREKVAAHLSETVRRSARRCSTSRTARDTPCAWRWRSWPGRCDGGRDGAGHLWRHPAADRGDAPAAGRHACRGRQCRDRADAPRFPTRRATAASCGIWTAARSPRSWSTRTRPRRSARSGRSTPGCSRSTARLLTEALGKVRTDNSQGEEYLTDVLGILREAGHRVGAAVAGDHREIAGINNRVQLAEARRMLNGRLLERRDARGGDRGGSGVDVGGCDGVVRAGRGGASGDAVAGCRRIWAAGARWVRTRG